MSEMALFKSKEEKAAAKFDKGSDYISQKKFGEALAQLEKSIKKGNASPDVYVLKQMLEMRGDYEDLTVLNSALNTFKKYPDVTVKYGVYDVPVSRLIQECELRIEANSKLQSEESAQKGNDLCQIAGKYLENLGDETLMMEEIFSEEKITGRQYSNFLYARGFEILAESTKWDDPRKAAEYMQSSLHYNQLRNDTERMQKNEDFINGAKVTANCWFCGRQVSGSNIHFVPMPARITEPIAKQTGNGPLPTNDKEHVFACRACFSSINIQDEAYLRIAKRYADEEDAALRSELIGYINDLQRQINNLARK